MALGPGLSDKKIDGFADTRSGPLRAGKSNHSALNSSVESMSGRDPGRSVHGGFIKASVDCFSNEL
jgi:hypothetical protein